MQRRLVVLWDNFGPYHVDRCEAAARALGHGWQVHGVEISARSSTYGWRPPTSYRFSKETLFEYVADSSVSNYRILCRLLKVMLKNRGSIFCFCHYERFPVFLTALTLRVLQQDVFVMNESKFDDRPRSLISEIGKAIFYFPYKGAMGSSSRTLAYYRFFGFHGNRIATGYDVLSLDRIRNALVDAPGSPKCEFSERYFVIVARLVSKKNIIIAFRAFALYSNNVKTPRRLVLCGNGPLDGELRELAKDLQISKYVVFLGWLDADVVAKVLGSSLALILPSVEEQFGLVVIEALALNVPVLVSENCGARDELVRTGVNGFIFEPDNSEGLAFFMELLSENRRIWEKMANSCEHFASKGDSFRFGEGVRKLISLVRDDVA